MNSNGIRVETILRVTIGTLEEVSSQEGSEAKSVMADIIISYCGHKSKHFWWIRDLNNSLTKFDTVLRTFPRSFD